MSPIKARHALIFSLVLAFALSGASSAFAISRDAVLARGQVRVDRPVPYSQTSYYAGYRTDCSGYVSMCWSTGTSWNTRSFFNVTHTVPVNQLKPGDALLKAGYHIRMFYGWVDDAHTRYVAYETADHWYAGTRIHSIADDLEFGYIPSRYDRISDSPKPRNLLKNPAFDVWARSWGSQPEQPVWWQTQDQWWQTSQVVHRKDSAHSGLNSLQLVNPSGDPTVFAELSQSATITPGARYSLTAWAKKDFDPRGLELKLVYLDAAGESVAETVTTGDVFGVNRSSFRPMSLVTTSPTEAVRATVSVRIAGATTTSTVGLAVLGSAVTLDDISLVRPQISVGIKASTGTVYNGNTLTLSGSVTPTGTIGNPALTYVQKPGQTTWILLPATKVYASGSAATWKRTYAFTRSMPRGTYRFKTSVGPIPGFRGASSTTTGVTLK